MSIINTLRTYQEPQKALLKLIEIYQIRLRRRRGINITEEDWDNLLILDGCRYDTFKQENHIQGTLEAVWSQGSQTVQFLKSNFNSHEFQKTVYISANPNIKFMNAKFHDRIRLWEEKWNEELEVVPPKAVTERAIKAEQKYPHKHLIVHYMQPHFPFIGEYGQSLYETGQIRHHDNGNKFWKQLERVGERKFRKAYQENLRITLPHVEELLSKLTGKSVVSSDHGNEFGRYGVYGHPSNTYTNNLIRVPWFTIEGNKRKSIKSGSATIGPTTKEAEAKERLKKLGYIS